MRYILTELLAGTGLFLLFFLSGLALERAVLGRRLEGVAVVERSALGLVAWIALLFAASSTGLLAPAPVLVGGAGLLALLAGTLLRERRWIVPLPRLQGPRWRLPGPPLLVLLAALVPVAAVLLLQSLRPDVSWDANVYHLTVPRIFLENGGFVRIPFNVYSNWPLNLELLFALAMMVHDYVTAKLLHFGLGALTCVGIYLASKRSSGRAGEHWIGLLAIVFFLLNDVVQYEIRIAYVDLGLAFFFLVAFDRLGRFLDDPSSPRRDLLLAGVCAGAAAGVKLNGGFVLVSLLLVLAVETLRTQEHRPSLWRSSLWLAAPAAVLLLPWLVKSSLFTGNPLYPLLFDLFGGPEWSSTLARQHAEWQRSIGMGRSAVDHLLLAVRVILFGDHGYRTFDGRLHPLWIVLLPVSLLSVRRDPLVRRALLASLAYFALWAVTSQQMRFLIPVLALLSPAAARAVADLLERLPRPALRTAGPHVVALGAALLLVLANLVYLRQTPAIVEHFLRHDPDVTATVVRPVHRFIENELDPDSKLLLLNTNHGFFVRRPYIADSFFEASQLVDHFRDAATVAEAQRRLERLGITHVLIENRRRWMPYPSPLLELVRDPERARAVFESPDGRFTLLELDTHTVSEGS